MRLSLPTLGHLVTLSHPLSFSAQSSLSCALEALEPFWEVLVRSGRRQGVGLVRGQEWNESLGRLFQTPL